MSLPNLQIFVFDFHAEKIKSLLPLTEGTSDVRSNGNVFSYCLTDISTAYSGEFFVTSEAKAWQGKKQIVRLGYLKFKPAKVISVAYIFIILKCQRGNNGNKLHSANTSCVVYFLFVFAFLHDKQSLIYGFVISGRV